MRRPKYNSDICAKVLMYIEEGRTVKDVCRLCGIRDMTLGRWRKRFPDFNKAYIDAVGRQWRNAENLKNEGIRTYQRKAEVLHKKEEETRNRDTDGRPVYYEGFRIRYGSIEEDRPFEPCIDPASGRVKYLKRQGGRYVQFCLTVDAFRRSHPDWYRKLVEANVDG